MPTGSCVCGDLTWSFSGEPVVKGICHCLTCRKLTGSAYATAMMVPDPDWTSNSPASTTPTPATDPTAKAPDFVLRSATGAKPRQTSGTHECGLDMTFFGCQSCPSTLYKRAPEGFPGLLIVFAGGLDHESASAEEGEAKANTSAHRGRGGLEGWGPPQVELWVKYRLPWINELEGVKQCQEFS